MSHSLVSLSSHKRKRPEKYPSGPVDAERTILDLIKSKKHLGICVREIKQGTKLADDDIKKSLKSLSTKCLIKEVVNIHNKRNKHYMAVEFEPSNEISGGDWYVDGELNKEFIDELQKLCLRYMRMKKVVTLERVHDLLKKVVTFDISSQQVGEILNLIVLNNFIIEVKSTGLGDYHSIPVGTICYRVASGAGVLTGPRTGAFASIPCGACPRISMCTPDGVIAPSNCVHYEKWLNIEF
ncbi:hypothetical protein DH2020_005845 [Rehmannia glutinosa]|uniref:RNA polymerase III subunit C6 n=1 Tax=Rehmannia glutinosa TaxID=99300 RepID=A0ABR0XH97_REHGL